MPYKDLEVRRAKQKEYSRKWYSANQSLQIARIRERRAKLLEKIRKYKIDKGCLDCGYNKHPAALEFDHISDDKENDVSRMLHNGYSWERILVEIEKCEIVCANCHRIRTETRLLG